MPWPVHFLGPSVSSLSGAGHRAQAWALALMVLAVPGFAQGDPGADRFDSLRPAVVKILARELIVRGVDPGVQELLVHQGSGVIVTGDGKVLTVAHLVQSADDVEVEFADGSRSSARVHASEPAADVALLELRDPPEGLKPAVLGDSDAVSVGDHIMVIGFPFDLAATATFGRLSGRLTPSTPYGRVQEFRVLTFDAHLLRGASGGPLFDAMGRVVGIATQLMTNRGEAVGIGFAVAANTARSLLMDRRSLWTGIAGRLVSGNLAKALNLPQPAGILVERVAAYSPASAMEIRAGSAGASVLGEEFVIGGDIILSIQGISLAEADGYARASAALAALGEGDRMRMTVLRAGAVMTLESALQRARR